MQVGYKDLLKSNRSHQIKAQIKELSVIEQKAQHRADHAQELRIAEQQRVTQLQKEYDLLLAYAATLGITPLKSTDPIDASRRQDPLISVSTAPPPQIVDTV